MARAPQHSNQSPDVVWHRRALAVGVIGVAIAVPSSILAVRELSGHSATAADRAGADGQRVVAVVDGDPIPRAAYNHWLRIAQAGQPDSRAPRGEVIDFLISASWLEHEARDRGVAVSSTEVDTEFQNIRTKQFPVQQDYENFLKSSKQSEDDLKFRVRLNLLSGKLRPSLQEEAGSPTTTGEAFFDKWHTKTVCAPEFVTRDCANQ
jgi:hypothetical protein